MLQLLLLQFVLLLLVGDDGRVVGEHGGIRGVIDGSGRIGRQIDHRVTRRRLLTRLIQYTVTGSRFGLSLDRFVGLGRLGLRFGDLVHLAEHHFEFQRANRDSVTLFEPDLTGDGFSVDNCSVGAAKVPQPEAKLIERKDAMVAADRFTVRPKMTVLFPSNQELAIRVQ